MIQFLDNALQTNELTDERTDRKTHKPNQIHKTLSMARVSNNKMVSLLSHKQSFVHFIGRCLFGRRHDKLWRSQRIYIKTFTVLLYINDIPQALWNSHTYLHTIHMQTIQVSFINIKTLLKSIKYFLHKEFANMWLDY